MSVTGMCVACFCSGAPLTLLRPGAALSTQPQAVATGSQSITLFCQQHLHMCESVCTERFSAMQMPFLSRCLRPFRSYLLRPLRCRQRSSPSS